VDDATKVRVLERARDARRDDERDIERQGLAVAEELACVDALDVLEHHEDLAVLLDEIVNRDDVLVVQRAERARLASEPLRHVLVARDVREHDLHGDGPSQEALLAPIDLGHPSAADRLLDPGRPRTRVRVLLTGGRFWAVAACLPTPYSNASSSRPTSSSMGITVVTSGSMGRAQVTKSRTTVSLPNGTVRIPTTTSYDPARSLSDWMSLLPTRGSSGGAPPPIHLRSNSRT